MKNFDLSILHFAQLWGGSEEYLLLLIDGCLNFGYKVQLVFSSRYLKDAFERKLSSQLSSGSLEIQLVEKPIFSLPKLLGYIAQARCIHFHRHHDLWLAFLVRLFFPKCKIIFSAHVFVAKYPPGIASLDWIIANSQYTLAPLLSYVKERVPKTVIYPVIKKIDLLELLDRKEKPKHSLKRGFPSLLMAGNMHKNQIELIDIFALLKQKLPEAVLILAAPAKAENFQANLDKVVQLIEVHGLQDSVQILLEVDRSEYLRILNTIDIFVYTNTVEPYGLVLLEAALLTIPIVAYEFTGGSGELLSFYQNCSLLQNGDREGFCNAIIEITSRKSSQKVFNHDLYDRFSHEKFIAEHLKIYVGLLKANRA